MQLGTCTQRDSGCLCCMHTRVTTEHSQLMIDLGRSKTLRRSLSLFARFCACCCTRRVRLAGTTPPKARHRKTMLGQPATKPHAAAHRRGPGEVIGLHAAECMRVELARPRHPCRSVGQAGEGREYRMRRHKRGPWSAMHVGHRLLTDSREIQSVTATHALVRSGRLILDDSMRTCQSTSPAPARQHTTAWQGMPRW